MFRTVHSRRKDDVDVWRGYRRVEDISRCLGRKMSKTVIIADEDAAGEDSQRGRVEDAEK